MNCLQSLSKSSVLPFHGLNFHPKMSIPSSFSSSVSVSVNAIGMANFADRYPSMAAKAISGSASNADASGAKTKEEDEKSETYSHNMTEAMGAVLTYRHELGMNYNFIRPDLIVGSCLQNPEDVDKLRSIGVKTIFCLQQDPDLEYFGVVINAIQEYAKECGDIHHIRAEIRDFDAFDLRIRLPAVVSKLLRAVNQNGGVTYIHCTAGLGRAPAVAMAYMFWVLGYKFSDAHDLLVSKRPCFPKIDAIKSATADILTGLRKKLVTLTWKNGKCSTVEISGLDIGWGQRIPLKLDEQQGLWILKRELLEGRYEYKYVVDGEWLCNQNEPFTSPNKDGHINNYVQVVSEGTESISAAVRTRLSVEDADLAEDERIKIREFLETCPSDE